MRNVQDNRAYLLHIKDASEKIIDYVSKNSFQNFEVNEWDQDAVMRNLEIIGEAVNNLEDKFLEMYPDVPWRTIVNLRNVLIHDYVDVDMNVVWQIIAKDLPIFYRQVLGVLEK
ncbi:MAG: DUF86 domain-containing protein [Patescibacteria group bacterium]